jgi:hypothetical protein
VTKRRNNIFSLGANQGGAATFTLFRLAFGILMALAMLRMFLSGRIAAQFIEPSFRFTYFGFDWVPHPGNPGIYLLFGTALLASLLLLHPRWFRWGAPIFFLAFTWIELIDKTTYLNHYYLVSCLAFMLIWLPYGSDARSLRRSVLLLRIMIAIVYVHAGLAKIGHDWLFEALPLRIWLPAKEHLPLIGPLLAKPFTAYLFSWIGCLYDLSIPFLLWHASTRKWAYLSVLTFHGLTAWMFPIGVFPWVMAAASLLFLDDNTAARILSRMRISFSTLALSFGFSRYLLMAFLFVQVLLPWRFLLYPGTFFYTEQGYRFSWRVMLVEKHGMAEFTVRDADGIQRESIRNEDYLTPNQIKQMSFQPDMILEFAHHLGAIFKQRGWKEPAVHAEVWVTLNGRPAKMICDPQTDLMKVPRNLEAYTWVRS